MESINKTVQVACKGVKEFREAVSGNDLATRADSAHFLPREAIEDSECSDFDGRESDSDRGSWDEGSPARGHPQGGSTQKTSGASGSGGHSKRAGHRSRLLAPTKASLAKARVVSGKSTTDAILTTHHGRGDRAALDKAEQSLSTTSNLQSLREGLLAGAALKGRNGAQIPERLLSRDKPTSQDGRLRSLQRERRGVPDVAHKTGQSRLAPKMLEGTSRESSPEPQTFARLAAAKRYSESVKALHQGNRQGKAHAEHAGRGKYSGKSSKPVKEDSRMVAEDGTRRLKRASGDDKLVVSGRLPAVMHVKPGAKASAVRSRFADSAGNRVMMRAASPSERLSAKGDSSVAARRKATGAARPASPAESGDRDEREKDAKASKYAWREAPRMQTEATCGPEDLTCPPRQDFRGADSSGQSEAVNWLDERRRDTRSGMARSFPSSAGGADSGRAEEAQKAAQGDADATMRNSWPRFSSTRVPFWPAASEECGASSKGTESPMERNMATAPIAGADVRQQGDGIEKLLEGNASPISPLELRLVDDNGSQSTMGDDATGNGLEDSDVELEMKDLDRHYKQLTKSPSKASSVDSADNLEFACLDFLGDIKGMEQDLEYVRHVLVMSGFAGGRPPPWHTKHLPINPALFEQLELGIALDAGASMDAATAAACSEERRQRMLLFDAVNEALCRRLSVFADSPPWVHPWRPVVGPRPTGKDLLEEVWEEIHDWPVPTSDELYDILDDAARRDMVRGLDKWNECGQEEAEVVFDLEAAILQGLLEEVVCSFAAIEVRRMKKRVPQACPTAAAMSQRSSHSQRTAIGH